MPSGLCSRGSRPVSQIDGLHLTWEEDFPSEGPGDSREGLITRPVFCESGTQVCEEEMLDAGRVDSEPGHFVGGCRAAVHEEKRFPDLEDERASVPIGQGLRAPISKNMQFHVIIPFRATQGLPSLPASHWTGRVCAAMHDPLCRITSNGTSLFASSFLHL